MSIAKRAIMVPVMTLAVCAIAMVGLGFAISTSVTSDNNVVEKMMIDISESSFGDAAEPIENGEVNGLFNIAFTTEKSHDSNGITFNNKVDGGYAYLKIFGNAAPEKIYLNVGFSVSHTQSSQTADVTKITLSIYESLDSFTNNSPIGTVTVENEKNDDFKMEDDKNIACETEYIVAITGITAGSNTYSISYSNNGASITGAVSKVTNEVTNELTNEAVIIGNYNSMTMVFKASDKAKGTN